MNGENRSLRLDSFDIHLDDIAEVPLDGLQPLSMGARREGRTDNRFSAPLNALTRQF
ncbi:hypothetical protein [Rhodospirillum sp. A1_3_36]|uniref:hypothetical protein n=1 Tax=Rhodospirillum sp. A1_3_36 TaxID=3391666 RepID=UPI0039A73FF8